MHIRLQLRRPNSTRHKFTKPCHMSLLNLQAHNQKWSTLSSTKQSKTRIWKRDTQVCHSHILKQQMEKLSLKTWPLPNIWQDKIDHLDSMAIQCSKKLKQTNGLHGLWILENLPLELMLLYLKELLVGSKKTQRLSRID